MNIRDIIEALRESPYWETLPLNERTQLVFYNARSVPGNKMINILSCLTMPEEF
ncbi:MAG TPA: hypothetical protein VMB78_00325 [Dissulfurispiraceae bacterium]|nr:hypothetical protein [Dissulfurispiraceae bacterium]